MCLLSIFDSIFAALHISVRKLLKVSDSLCDFVEPLLHNSGIPAYNAVLPIMPYYAEGEQGPAEKEPEKPVYPKSKKGVPIVILLIVAILLLWIPLLLVLGVGFIVNQIRYGRFMK